MQVGGLRWFKVEGFVGVSKGWLNGSREDCGVACRCGGGGGGSRDAGVIQAVGFVMSDGTLLAHAAHHGSNRWMLLCCRRLATLRSLGATLRTTPQ
jgi:hypothetical protein